MINSRAKENWAKRKGALHRPKGRTISKKYRPFHFIHSRSQSEGWTGMFGTVALMSSLDIKQFLLRSWSMAIMLSTLMYWGARDGQGIQDGCKRNC